MTAAILPIARTGQAPRWDASAARGGQAPQWDAKAGVWVGEKVVSGNMEVPDPLWIFGYGSLCWRPDFPHEETMVGRVRGWGRYFAQRSCDHRGTPDNPGLVATLLSDSQLQFLGLRDADATPSTTCGLCYRVAAADAERVLDGLDFREKVCAALMPPCVATSAARRICESRVDHSPIACRLAGWLHARGDRGSACWQRWCAARPRAALFGDPREPQLFFHGPDGPERCSTDDCYRARAKRAQHRVLDQTGRVAQAS